MKMSVGDHWLEREREREKKEERVYVGVEGVTDRSGESSFS